MKTRRRQGAAAAALVAVLLSACGGVGSKAGQTSAGRVEPGGTSEADGETGLGIWASWGEDGPDELHGGTPDAAIADGSAPPDGTDEARMEIAEIPFRDPEDAGWPLGMRLEDPCMLVNSDEFNAWSGTTLASDPIVLEDGEACGFIALGNELRMAIGVVPVSTEEFRFLSPGEAPDGASAETIEGFPSPVPARRVVWVPGYPVEDSSLLVFEGEGFDLVVEMSSRDGRSADSLRDGAIHFATLALGRLS